MPTIACGGRTFSTRFASRLAALTLLLVYAAAGAAQPGKGPIDVEFQGRDLPIFFQPGKQSYRSGYLQPSNPRNSSWGSYGVQYDKQDNGKTVQMILMSVYSLQPNSSYKLRAWRADNGMSADFASFITNDDGNADIFFSTSPAHNPDALPEDSFAYQGSTGTHVFDGSSSGSLGGVVMIAIGIGHGTISQTLPAITTNVHIAIELVWSNRTVSITAPSVFLGDRVTIEGSTRFTLRTSTTRIKEVYINPNGILTIDGGTLFTQKFTYDGQSFTNCVLTADNVADYGLTNLILVDGGKVIVTDTWPPVYDPAPSNDIKVLARANTANQVKARTASVPINAADGEIHLLPSTIQPTSTINELDVIDAAGNVVLSGALTVQQEYFRPILLSGINGSVNGVTSEEAISDNSGAARHGVAEGRSRLQAPRNLIELINQQHLLGPLKTNFGQSLKFSVYGDGKNLGLVSFSQRQGTSFQSIGGNSFQQQMPDISKIQFLEFREVPATQQPRWSSTIAPTNRVLLRRRIGNGSWTPVQ